MRDMENSIKILKWAVMQVEVIDTVSHHLETVKVPEKIIETLGIAPYEQATATSSAGLCWLTHVVPTDERGLMFYGPRAEKLDFFSSVVLYGHHWAPLDKDAPEPQVWDGKWERSCPISDFLRIPLSDFKCESD